LGNKKARRGVGPYMYYRKAPKEKGLDVLGVFSWLYQKARNLLGEGLGSIKEETYRAHTVPIIHGYIELCRRQRIHLVLIQDGAPGHVAADTKEDLREKGIIIIFWPTFSLDLNPIERV
jgi:hypothetical protein